MMDASSPENFYTYAVEGLSTDENQKPPFRIELEPKLSVSVKTPGLVINAGRTFHLCELMENFARRSKVSYRTMGEHDSKITYYFNRAPDANAFKEEVQGTLEIYSFPEAQLI